MVDFADAAYFHVRIFLAVVTGISALCTLRYGLELHSHPARRTMAFIGAGWLAVDVVLSSYDAVYNGFLTPGTPIALINWLWLFGFDLLLPIWAFLLLHTQRQRDAGEAELARLAVTDLLTGVLNRRGFLDQAHAVIARARRSNEPVAVAMLDIDRFKTINDGFGHDAGDEACGQAISSVGSEERSSSSSCPVSPPPMPFRRSSVSAMISGPGSGTPPAGPPR